MTLAVTYTKADNQNVALASTGDDNTKTFEVDLSVKF
jgi:hypothetical protein